MVTPHHGVGAICSKADEAIWRQVPLSHDSFDSMVQRHRLSVGHLLQAEVCGNNLVHCSRVVLHTDAKELGHRNIRRFVGKQGKEGSLHVSFQHMLKVRSQHFFYQGSALGSMHLHPLLSNFPLQNVGQWINGNDAVTDGSVQSQGQLKSLPPQLLRLGFLLLKAVGDGLVHG